jgi:hypothetical protein
MYLVNGGLVAVTIIADWLPSLPVLDTSQDGSKQMNKASIPTIL